MRKDNQTGSRKQPASRDSYHTGILIFLFLFYNPFLLNNPSLISYVVFTLFFINGEVSD